MTWIPKAAPKPPVREKRKRKPLTSHTRMKKINKRRGGSKFPKRRDKAYTDWVRTRRCVIYWSFDRILTDPKERWARWHKCLGPVQVCHVKTRGAGGDDVGNVVPMCAGAHDEQHRIGIRAFQKRWGIDLAKIAAGLAPKYTEGW